MEKRKQKTMTEVLRQAIVDSGLPLLTLGKASGVDRASLRRFMSGERSLRLDMADRLADYLWLSLRRDYEKKNLSSIARERSIVFLPNKSGYDGDERARLKDFQYCSKAGRAERWSCLKTTLPGDLFLFWFAKPSSCIAGVGVAAGNVTCETNNGVDWTGKKRLYFCEFSPIIRATQPVTLADIEDDALLARYWRERPFQGPPKRIDRAEVSSRLLTMIRDKNPGNSQLINLIAEWLPKS